MVKNMTRKSKKSVWIGIVLIIVLSGAFVVKSVDMNGNDMIQAEERKSINVDGNNGQEGQDMLTNPEVELPEQEDGMGENDEKVYEDKFIDLNIEYLGSGKSSRKSMSKKRYMKMEKNAHLRDTIYFKANGNMRGKLDCGISMTLILCWI